MLESFLLPWLDPGLHIFVDTHNSARKWDVHKNGEWVGSVEASQTFFIKDILNAFSGRKRFTKL